MCVTFCVPFISTLTLNAYSKGREILLLSCGREFTALEIIVGTRIWQQKRYKSLIFIKTPKDLIKFPRNSHKTTLSAHLHSNSYTFNNPASVVSAPEGLCTMQHQHCSHTEKEGFVQIHTNNIQPIPPHNHSSVFSLHLQSKRLFQGECDDGKCLLLLLTSSSILALLRSIIACLILITASHTLLNEDVKSFRMYTPWFATIS